MNTSDLFQETITALSANKVRSGLTMLGIIIGIASVIALVAVGNGAQASINASIQSLGSNLLIVMPGSSSSAGVSLGRGSTKTLTIDDANAIAAQVQNVAAVAPELTGRYQVVSSQTNTNTTVDGTVPSYTTVRNLQIAEGTFISDEQESDLAKVAVIGPTAATDLFPDGSDPVGQTIRVNDVIFTIIGETVSKGSSGAGSNQDDELYIPLATAQQYLVGTNENGEKYVGDINIEATDASDMTQVQNDATALLLQRHNISDPTQADFSILNQSDIVSAASSITGTFTILLGAVAGISLVVGGIGIMNMMLTSVTERTREIGLRKAIGATERDISNQFLLESMMLTVIGGLIGIALGWSISFIVALTGLLSPQVTIPSILLAFGVSAAIGIVFGWYPARRAAHMNPIDALRFE
jgi:putative ABC transport system permease protein